MPSFSISFWSSTSTRTPVALAHLARLLGEVGGRADVAGQVAQVLGERDARGDRRRLRTAALAFRELPAPPDVQRHLAQRALCSGGLLFRRSKR